MLSQMIGTIKASRDPTMAINQMAQSNPQMQQVMQIIQQNGGDAKSAFYNLARQKGVDPNMILQQLQNLR